MAGAAPSEHGHGGLVLAAVVVGGIALLSGILWARYGSAVFVEMVATAWAYCF